LQLVISASDDLLQKSRQEIIETCLAEVWHALPRARDAKITKSTVIKEATATFSPRPGVDLLRPPQKSRIDRLYLAGDWTATGWPATMEGAVRSGYLAAESILADAGTPQRFLRPDLPIEPLVKLLSKN
jgi:zeta-carotene desaturase